MTAPEPVAAPRYAIEAEGLVKRYRGRTVVRGIDFAIPSGRCVGFLGPNGAGKTTTLRMVLGQSPADAGRLWVLGLAMPANGRRVRAQTGVVPQIDNLDPDFTVVENLRIYGAYFGLRAPVLRRRIDQLLEFMGLTDHARAEIGALSGGMKRRLTIARALIHDPQLLILDEPTTGLDPQVRRMIWSRLRELRQAGKTLVLTTHYMEEAERVCDEVIVMDQGVILDRGAPAALVARHVQPEVVEISGPSEALARVAAGLPGRHLESLGDTLYCYTDDGPQVLRALGTRRDLTVVHRRTNLEDVFLRLTGRELRD